MKAATTTTTKPVLLIDTREQEPLAFTNLTSMSATMSTGDYSIQGAEDLFAIERKTVVDLVARCGSRDPSSDCIPF